MSPRSRVTHPEKVDIEQVRLFRAPPWVLRLTIEDDRSYLKVKVVRAAPLSNPDRYISFLDGKDEEICMVEDLDVLDEEARTIIKEELDRRYLTSRIEKIDSVRNEFGTSYWHVVTNRGRAGIRSPECRGERSMARRPPALAHRRGWNRFEVPDLNALDKKSSAYIEQVL